MKSALLLVLCLIKPAASSKAAAHRAIVEFASQSLSVPSSAFEDAYSLLENAAVMAVPDVQARLLSIMQQTSQKAAAVVGSSGTMDMDLLGITGAIAGLAGRNIPEDSRKMFVDSMKEVLGKLQEHIHAASSPAQERLDQLAAAYDRCNATLRTSLSTINSSEVTAARASHAACRTQESSAFLAWANCTGAASSATTGLVKAKSTRAFRHALAHGHLQLAGNGHDECATWPALKNKSPSDAAASCASIQNGETYGAYVERMQSYWTTRALEYERLKTKCDHTTATTTACPHNCASLKSTLDLKKSQCKHLQESFENEVCTRATRVDYAWNYYRSCYDSSNSTFWREVQLELSNVEARKTQIRATKRIDCLLKVFHGHDDPAQALKECQEKTHSANISIIIPDVPDRQTPPKLCGLPGSSAFQKEEYSDLPANTSAASSHACHLLHSC